MTIRREDMNDRFTKFHIDEPGVLHRFTAPDPAGDPHDHPWSFRSEVLWGGYLEEVFALGGSSELVHRRPGDVFEVPAGRIHRIVELFEGTCGTFILPGPHERTSGFYRWHDGQAFHRPWHRAEFEPYGGAAG